MRENWERVITATRGGLYESNYLKANSLDGSKGFWIKHNTLRPLEGEEGHGEFWVVWFERGEAPIVAKREVSWESLKLGKDRLWLESGEIRLNSGEASGELADIKWSLRLHDGGEALFHYPWDLLYRSRFPKKKALTPAPNLKFTGWIEVDGVRHEVASWCGMRGHNWGSEHAKRYAYGNCNVWDDGVERTVDGFSAKIEVAGRETPWISVLVGREPDVSYNSPRRWLSGDVKISDGSWELGWRSLRRGGMGLSMTADPVGYAGLRYRHPGGGESYCYNTKFADVVWSVGGETLRGSCGELELLFPEPLDGIALHPSEGWSAGDGDYRSEG